MVVLLAAVSCTESGSVVEDTAETLEADATANLASFVASIEEADYDDYKARPVRDETEFEAMKAHLLSLYVGARATSQFVLDGAIGDCIEVASQSALAGGAVEPTPAQPPEPGDLALPGASGETSLPVTGALCAPGSFPMTRLSLVALTEYETLNDLFAK